MKISKKILLSIFQFCLILQKVSSNNSADDDFEETGSLTSENIEDLTQADNFDNKAQYQESELIKSENEIKHTVINLDEPTEDSESEHPTNPFQPETDEEVKIPFSEELSIVTCLAAYSKLATIEREEFSKKLEGLFEEGGLYNNDSKMKIVEKYVINAVIDCEKRVRVMIDDLKRKTLTDIYHDILSIEILRDYIRFDSNIISSGKFGLDSAEIDMKKKMKYIQTKNEKGKAMQPSQKPVDWLIDVWGFWWTWQLLAVIIVTIVYCVFAIQVRKKISGAFKHQQKYLRTSMKTLVQQENDLNTKIGQMKENINEIKKDN